MRPKLAAAIGMNDCGGWPAQRDRVRPGIDGQLRGHPLGRGVADDPVAAGILDRAEIKLALGGGVYLQRRDPPVRGPDGCIG
jgi:hypothetical protein